MVMWPGKSYKSNSKRLDSKKRLDKKFKSISRISSAPHLNVGKRVFEKKVGRLFAILLFFRRLEKRI